MLSRLRSLIELADPDVVEDVKWRKPSNNMVGVPVWSHAGIICTGETYKDKVKLKEDKKEVVDLILSFIKHSSKKLKLAT